MAVSRTLAKMFGCAETKRLQQGRSIFTAVLSDVEPSQWTRASGCGTWSIGELVTHVVAATAMYAALLDGATAETAVNIVLSTATDLDHAPADFDHYAGAVQSKLAEPKVLGSTVHHPARDVQGHDLLGYALVEWVIHAWDLGRAGGRGLTIQPALAQAIYDRILPAVERLREMGAFEPAMEVPANAGSVKKLLGLLGRSPGPAPAG